MVQRFVRGQRHRRWRVLLVHHATDFSALIYWSNENDDDYGDWDALGGIYAKSPHEKRRFLLLQKDPLHTTNLMRFIQEHLTLAQASVGGVEAFRAVYLQNVDEALVDQMNTVLLR